MHQRHRMDLDIGADHELHAGEANSFSRQLPPAKAAAGLAIFSMILVRVAGMLSRWISCLEIGSAP